MKNILLLLLACLAVNKIKAQRWLPAGTTLTQSKADFKGMMLVGSKPLPIYINGPVMVHGKLCSYGSYTMGASLDTTIYAPLSFITYEDAGVVYWYRPVLEDFTVLFDFNKNVGDEWVIDGLYKGPFGEYCSRAVKIVSKKMVNINGFNLRSMRLSYSVAPFSYNNDVIEAIGGLETPFPDHAPCIKGIVDDYSEFFGLRCMDHPDIGFYDFKIAPNCNHSATSVQESKKVEFIKISPNPSTGSITIKHPSLQGVARSEAKQTEATVYDLLGRVVHRQALSLSNNEATIRLNLPPATYILELQDNAGNAHRERIVIQ
jgi:hypothetical protein